jgi:HTH-type transcriptional regulator/antitoxin HigA
MDIRLLKTEKDYQDALGRLDQIFDAAEGSAESDEADVLVLLIDDYENRHYPIEAPDPIEAIKIRMEEMQLKQKDIAPVLGGKNRASEILNRKRKLTVEMIRKLSERLNLSASLLIQEYKNSA